MIRSISFLKLFSKSLDTLREMVIRFIVIGYVIISS